MPIERNMVRHKYISFIKKHKPLFIFVVLPLIFGGGYIWIIAPSIYTSRAKILIQPTLSQGALPGAGSASLTALSPERSKDAYTLQAILYSWGTFKNVKRSIPLARFFKLGGFFTGYSGLATQFKQNDVRLYRFYRNHLITHISKRSGILSVKVDGFSQRSAQLILSASLRYAEATIVQSADALTQAQMKASIQGLKIAKDHLATINEHLFQLEKKYQVIHTGENYHENLEVLAHLQEQAAQLEAKRSALLLSTPESPSLKALAAAHAKIEGRIDAIRNHSDVEVRRAHPLQIWLARKIAAEHALSEAQSAYQKAATKAASEPYQISALAPVSTPHAPSGPSRWQDFGILLLVCLLLWGFLR